MTLLLAHAAPSIRATYPPGTHPFVAPGTGMSSNYVALASRLRSGGRVLPGLLSWLNVSPSKLLIAGCYSAGYALLRELTRSPEDRSAIAGWLFIDGGHASEDPDGTAADAEIGWLVGLVVDAAAGRTALCYGYTDVDPGTYASTQGTIDEALWLAGVAPTSREEPCPGCISGQMRVRTVGNLHIEGHNHRASAHDEHIQALQGWGAALAERCVSMVGGLTTPLEVALAELEAGVCEIPPGSNASLRIAEYFRGCERDGRPIGITKGAWCCAFATWCCVQAGLHVVQRAAVWEAVEDARQEGTWREVGYVPQSGDHAVFRRNGDPRARGQEGHIAVVEAVSGGEYTTIDGNHGDRVARVERRLSDDDLVGFIVRGSGLAELAKGATMMGLDRTVRELPIGP